MDFRQEIERRFLLQEEYLGTDKPVNKIKPLVSVSVATYQHEHFIRQCLDGILMQKTDFPFEIIMGEDHSKDNTRAICIEYANKYPDKIRLFLRDRKISHLYDENGKFIKRLNGVLGFGRMSSRGKYIALCEGDDYWTDPLKLQKQVDFLEENQDYSMCFTNAIKEKKGKREIYSDDKRSIFTVSDLINGCFFNTCTLMFRNINRPKINVYFKSGDLVLAFEMFKYGKMHKIQDITSVYRIHSGGIAQSFGSSKWTLNNIKLFQYYNVYLDKKYNKEFQSKIRELYGLLATDPKEKRIWKKAGYLFKSFLLIRNYLQLKVFVKNYLLESFRGE